MQSTKASILIVEDDAAVRNSFYDVFTALGYRARCASDGLAALIEMRCSAPEVLLSDMNMTGMSGFELLSVVRRRFPSIHVIAMSGMFAGEQIPNGVTADAFYQKGDGIAALLKIVESRPLQRRHGCDSPEPIWVQKNGHDASGAEFVTIACPECFRTFPMLLNGRDSMILDTVCTFCTCQIFYAVVEPNARMFPPPWQPASNNSLGRILPG